MASATDEPVSQLSSSVVSTRGWISPPTTSWKFSTTIILSVVLVRFVAVWSYNLWFHPLARFPGPFLGRASLIYRLVHTMRGIFHLAVTNEHRKYGPIVRVAPNELSFASAESWKSIYGHPEPGREIAPKTAFTEVYAAGFGTKCIGSERDAKKHSAMRKMLSPAFSQRALLEQEKIISDVVDKFVRIIGKKGGPGSGGINMTRWFEMGAFDLLSEMAFGESFRSLDTGNLHHWPAIILDHIFFVALIDNLQRIGWLAKSFGFLVPASLLRRNRVSNYSRQQVKRRLSKQDSRSDFVSLLADKVRDGQIGKAEMAAHVSTFVIAGGETVSTVFSTVTYYLARNPDKLQRLVAEIRTAFRSFDDINATETQKLPYLQAVLDEALRLVPPISAGGPRISRGFELHGYFIPAGAEVNINPWALARDEKYFAQPSDFKPERWIDPNSTDIKDASRPFSLGPRDCLGRNFAWMELRLVLAKMIWLYDIELVSKDVDFIRDITLYGLWRKPALLFRFHEASC